MSVKRVSVEIIVFDTASDFEKIAMGTNYDGHISLNFDILVSGGMESVQHGV